MASVEAQQALNLYKKDKALQLGITEDSVEELTTLSDKALDQEIKKLKETDEFLNLINLLPRTNANNDSFGLGTGCIIASRSDSASGVHRKALSAASGEVMPVNCENVNFDTFVTFEQLNSHARTPYFTELCERDNDYQTSQDLSRIGFHGKSANKQTDRTQNPNGEDILPGWFHVIREHNSDALLSEIITIGGEDFNNVESVARAVKNKVSPLHRHSNDLVMLIGDELVSHSGKSYCPISLKVDELKKKSILKQVDGSFAGLPSFTPSNFPPKGMLITSFDNLSVYFLLGSLRCATGIVNSREDRVENRKSIKLAYAIEQLSKAAALDFEKVTLL